MDTKQAKELLTILSDGIDPLTSEVLPDDHLCRKLEIVCALKCLLADSSAKPNVKQPDIAGKPWTSESDAELCRLFDAGMSRKERSAVLANLKKNIKDYPRGLLQLKAHLEP